MIIFINSEGSIINIVSSPVYQGSALKGRLFLVAPFPTSNSVSVHFKLPNGTITKREAMTPIQIGEEVVKDANGNDYSVWSYEIENRIVTAYAGEITAQFEIGYAIEGINNINIITTTSANFSVIKGVVNVPDDVIDKNQFDILIKLYSELADKTKEPLMTNLVVDDVTGFGTKFFNNDTTETIHFPSDITFSAISQNIKEITFTENSFTNLGGGNYSFYTEALYPSNDWIFILQMKTTQDIDGKDVNGYKTMQTPVFISGTGELYFETNAKYEGRILAINKAIIQEVVTDITTQINSAGNNELVISHISGVINYIEYSTIKNVYWNYQTKEITFEKFSGETISVVRVYNANDIDDMIISLHDDITAVGNEIAGVQNNLTTHISQTNGKFESIRVALVDIETNYATKTYVLDQISRIPKFEYKIVESLPTTDINPNIIYLLPISTGGEPNSYEEYLYVENKWEKIGSTAIDLSDYYTSTQIDEKLATKLSKATERGIVYGTNNFGQQTTIQYNVDAFGDGIVMRTGAGQVKGANASLNDDLLPFGQFQEYYAGLDKRIKNNNSDITTINNQIKENGFVLTTQQSMAEELKAQARTNIDVPSKTETDEIYLTLKEDAVTEITDTATFRTYFYNLRKSNRRHYQFEISAGNNQNILNAVGGYPATAPQDDAFIYVDLPYSEAGGFEIDILFQSRNHSYIFKKIMYSTLNSNWKQTNWINLNPQIDSEISEFSINPVKSYAIANELKKYEMKKPTNFVEAKNFGTNFNGKTITFTGADYGSSSYSSYEILFNNGYKIYGDAGGGMSVKCLNPRGDEEIICDGYWGGQDVPYTFTDGTGMWGSNCVVSEFTGDGSPIPDYEFENWVKITFKM